MRKFVKFMLLTTIAMWLTGCAAQQFNRFATTHSNHVAPLAQSAERCSKLLVASTVSPGAGLNPSNIGLANWNARKGHDASWRLEFANLSRGRDLVLLQEAAHPGAWRGKTGFWSFAPGYQTGTMETGVVTLSGTAPVVRCALVAYEPWLRTPKATNITEFALAGRSETLVVVNVHALNFSMGTGKFRIQIADAVAAVDGHSGPLIFSGDFNTWRQGRTKSLRDLLGSLDLEPVQFTDDRRSRVLGQHIDHVFARGLGVVKASTREFSTSDHNPLFVTFAL